MSMLNHDPIHQWVEEHVDAFIDGELDRVAHARFEALLEAHEDVAAVVREANSLRQFLRTMPGPTCPAAVTHAVLEHAKREAAETWRERIREHVRAITLQTQVLLRPALTMAVVATLVVTAALFGNRSDQRHDAVNREAVELALAQVKWALAYVSDVGLETGRTVRDDVIEARVNAPVRHSLDVIR